MRKNVYTLTYISDIAVFNKISIVSVNLYWYWVMGNNKLHKVPVNYVYFLWYLKSHDKQLESSFHLFSNKKCRWLSHF